MRVFLPVPSIFCQLSTTTFRKFFTISISFAGVSADKVSASGPGLKSVGGGKYLMIPHGNSGARKPTFISIPKDVDQTKITATKIKEIIDNHKKKEIIWKKK